MKISKISHILFYLILTLMFLHGCHTKSQNDGAPTQPKEKLGLKDLEIEIWERKISTPKESINFSNLRNPFLDPTSLAKYQETLEFNFILKGILQKEGKRYALLEDPLRRGFIVSEGVRLGNFKVKKIGENYLIAEYLGEKLINNLGPKEITLILKKE